MSSSKADTLLAVEDWAWRGESRHQHEQDHQRQPNRQRKENAGNVESEFPALFINAPVCGVHDGCRPCNASARRDVAKKFARQDYLGFYLIRQSSGDRGRSSSIKPDPQSAKQAAAI